MTTWYEAAGLTADGRLAEGTVLGKTLTVDYLPRPLDRKFAAYCQAHDQGRAQVMRLALARYLAEEDSR